MHLVLMKIPPVLGVNLLATMIMKRKYSFLAILAALSLVACQVEEAEVLNDTKEEEVTLTTITAHANEADTKAFVDGLQVKWSASDVIVVADEDDTEVDFTLNAGENTNSGTFSGDLSGKALGNYALYPKSANTDIDGTDALIDYITGWDYGKSEVPMYGIKGVGDTYSFNNIGGAIKVVYSNVPSEAKKFVITETHTGGSEKYITGTVGISDLDSTPAFDFSGLDGKVVTVNNVSSGDLTLVIPIPTGSGYNFNVKLIDASSKTIPGSEKNATGIDIKANKLKAFPTISIPDSKVFFEERFAASTGTLTTWSGEDARGTFTPDNDGWTVSGDKQYGAGACAKFGTSSVQGEATTPSIAIPSAYRSMPVTLHFKAGAWKDDSNDLTLTVTGATASSTDLTMSNAAWKEFDITLTSLSSEISVTFTAGERFFLDDVVVFFGPTLPSERDLPGFSYSTHSYAAATGGVFVAPTLTNPNSITVKYSSSDHDIATVDENTGDVTIGTKTGTVRITASFDGDMTYRPGSDYYDIEVSDPVYVHYWINGVETSVAAAEGQALNTVLPPSPDCGISGYEFSGWSETTVTTTDTEPTYTSQTTVPALGITLYAVFVLVDEEDVVAGSVTYNSSDFNSRGTSGGGGGYSYSEGGVTFTFENAYESTHVKVYGASSSITITANRNITGITVAFTGSSNATIGGDDFTVTGSTGTWAGTPTRTVNLAKNSGTQARVTSFVVSLAAGKISTYSGYTTSPSTP